MNLEDQRGYYAILGLTPRADAGEIKAAYRRKAMELHPDRNKAANSTRQFQFLNEAHSVLGEPVSRAQYDTMSIKAEPQASAAPEKPPEPIVCSCCGKVSAQPRYAIFFEVKSFILVTTRSTIQGIFCSGCAEKKAFRASTITWILGWWGLPWGPIYSIQALFRNLMGGQQPANINARLAAYQARVFAALGKINMARAVAFDALVLAKKIKSNHAIASMKKGLGYDVEEEGKVLGRQIEGFLEALGGGGVSASRLKDAWSIFHRPFYVQGLVLLAVAGAVAYVIQTASPSVPLQGHKPYVTDPHPYMLQSYSPSSPSVLSSLAYVRPLAAPNGKPWPAAAGYVTGYVRGHAKGHSKVTIDNSRNDSDVFVKLVSVDGPEALPVRVFFIPAQASFTLNKVTSGSYDIRYRDLDSGALSRSEPFSLEENRTNAGVKFNNMTMTLYKVRNGNMETYALSEDEF
jgi:hypothetical protein